MGRHSFDLPTTLKSGLPIFFGSTSKNLVRQVVRRLQAVTEKHDASNRPNAGLPNPPAAAGHPLPSVVHPGSAKCMKGCNGCDISLLLHDCHLYRTAPRKLSITCSRSNTGLLCSNCLIWLGQLLCMGGG